MKKLRTPPKLPTSHRHKTTAKTIAKPGTSTASNVSAHDYDPETGHLTVTFAGGRRYRYKDVPASIAEEMDTCQSRGQHLHRHVIGKYDHDKISD